MSVICFKIISWAETWVGVHVKQDWLGAGSYDADMEVKVHYKLFIIYIYIP